MKIKIEMFEGKDYPKSILSNKKLKELFELKIRNKLGLRKEDKVKICLKE